MGFTRRGIVKEGFLWKMAKADPSWTRLWCICKPEALFFFRPQQRLLEYRNPMLVLGLGESGGLSVANVQALREHCFIVETSSGDYHYFAANSDEERKEWKYAIKHRKAKSRSTPAAAAAADATTHGDDWANESWIWTPDRPEPSPFAWEDVKPTQIKMLNLLPLIQNEPIAKGSVPELELRADDIVVDKQEVAYFRTKVTKVVQAQSMRRVRLILAELTDAPVPSNFPGVFLVLFRMGKNAYRVRCSKDTNLKRVIIEEVLFRAQAVDMSVSWALPAIEDFMIRCGRLNEYIVDADISLHSIVYVRDAITKSRAIEFDLLPYEAQLHHTDGASVDDSPAGEQSFCSIEADEGLGFDLTVQNCFHVHDVSKRFEVKVKSVENLNKQLLYDANSFYGLDIEGDRVNVFVAFSLYFGEQLLAPVLHTQPVLPSQPIWEDWLVTELLSMENIPREARLCFTLYACKAQGGGAMGMITNLFRPANQTVPLAATEITYADFRGVLRRGSYCLPMWSLVTPAAGSPRQEVALVVEFDATSPKLISFSGETRRSTPDASGQTRDEEAEEEGEEHGETPAQHEQPLLYLILMRDALYEMSTEEKALVWKYRGYVRSQRPYSLAKVLLAAPSTNRQMIAAIHALLANWPPLPPVHALELLGARYVDTEVRRYAVNCLRELTDRQLVEYLPQLIQVLKSEPHHYSHLFEFLFLRSMRSIVLGHPFFWHLTSELHNESHSARFKLMIEAFLAASDDDGTTEEMKRELAVVAEFARVAKELKGVPKDERTKVLQAKLRLLELPSSFLLPYNPKFEVSRLLVEKCRVMDSMTSPLWLVFENRERQTAHIIFKVGDDLRTDILSLQMIRIMDQLWRNEGLDLHMQPYRAVSTGKDEGIIEVVTNSETTSAISQAYGGGGAVSAFSRTALAEWLRACNPTEAAYREAVTNFTLSCAGYCVATYILGVGDRHNDNIMITYGGNLFHIDFAYFLGRRVTFAGIPRETTPFVLTPAFVQAMGGLDSSNFRSFVSHCCRAYNVIRRHGHLFITLFAMMVSSGMSQLESLDDLDYLRRALALELTDAEASARFTQLIQESCSNQITQLNNAVHIFAHS